MNFQGLSSSNRTYLLTSNELCAFLDNSMSFEDEMNVDSDSDQNTNYRSVSSFIPDSYEAAQLSNQKAVDKSLSVSFSHKCPVEILVREADNPTHITHLGVRIIKYIFSFLDTPTLKRKVALLSKSFNKVSSEVLIDRNPLSKNANKLIFKKEKPTVLDHYAITELKLKDALKNNSAIKANPLKILKNYPNLRKLDCSGCKITKLSKSILFCTKLVEINFSNNKIKVFPEILTRLPSLQLVNFYKNPIKAQTIPKNITFVVKI